MSQFPQRFRFYLADTLARDIKVLAYFFQRSFMTTIVQTKTQAYYSLLARAQSLQHVPAISRRLEVITRAAGLSLDLSSIKSPS